MDQEENLQKLFDLSISVSSGWLGFDHLIIEINSDVIDRPFSHGKVRYPSFSCHLEGIGLKLSETLIKFKLYDKGGLYFVNVGR